MSEEYFESRKNFLLAVLIDADNIPHASIKDIMEEITKNGIPTIRRIYGDWTKPAMSGWKAHLLELSITPVQQYAYTAGKNATDSARIIDAMDILHRENVDGFCIVSSDSDFTRLASRLREFGKTVIGIGEKKTPQPFISSCNKFIYIEILRKSDTPKPTESVKKNTVKVAAVSNVSAEAKSQPTEKPSLLAVDGELKVLLKDVVNDVSNDTGWAHLADVGNHLLLRKPDFDSRNYGFDKLSLLIKSCNTLFEIDERSGKTKRLKSIYVRNKQGIQ
jgi:uncharacterized LabA/DUF88 family protein